jgi:hypothetical protein
MPSGDYPVIRLKTLDRFGLGELFAEKDNFGMVTVWGGTYTPFMSYIILNY